MQTITFLNRKLVVADEEMEATLKAAVRASETDATVLLCGESGTGKELIARFIHERSARAKNPFVSVNCAAIPEGLMEAELFGYERGAFTGAIAQRIGKFERADRGTILLDEISEMTMALQAKLLRVLQESEIDRLGGRDPIGINSRVIATTNREPIELIRQEKFREDLYYRLNVIRIDCKPLRGRVNAITDLANHFLEQAAIRYGKPGLKFTSDAVARLRSHTWPGNIRELSNAIERAAIMADGQWLSPENIEFLLPLDSAKSATNMAGKPLALIEQEHILSTLETTDGNRAETARKLGISVRTLRNKLKEYSA